MTELALAEAVPLAHALVDRVAVDVDVRVLFIKGPAAMRQGLRGPRASVDVDALVDPARRDRLAEHLTELGWVDENPYTSPTVLPMHSLTHRHPSWPCELDLHDRFPGFFDDPQDVFERLWERRQTVLVAGREIPCPDPAGHALVLALHSLRDPHDGAKAHELAMLEGRVTEIADDDWLLDLARFAADLGAADTAAPFLDRVGAPAVGRGTTEPADLRAWDLRTRPADVTAVSWVHELRRLPWSRRPGFLWYAACLTEPELRLSEPDLPPGRSAVLRARVRRLRRGLSALPAAVRSVRRPGGSPTEPRHDRDVAGEVGEVGREVGEVGEVVITTLLRAEGGTGVQTHLQALVAHLRGQGRSVTVVTPFSARSPLVRPVFALRLPLRRLSRSMSVRWYRHWHAHYLRSALRRHLREEASGRVVYAQDPISADVALTVRGSEPVVMVAHFNVSQADEWAERGDISRDDRYFRAIRSFEARVLPRLDGIVYVSAWSRDQLLGRVPELREVPAATVPNFVEPGDDPSLAPAVVRADLVSVGTLEPRKNQGYLLDVLAAADRRGHRYSLSLIGDGPSRADYERRTAERGLGDRVSFLGFCSDARAHLAGHRLYCHAALVENLPLALIEAMAEGLPVVTAAVGGIPSMLTPGVEGAFWPLDDSEAAATVLIDLLGDPERLLRCGTAARDRVEREFAAEAVVPRLVSFLGDVRRHG